MLYFARGPVFVIAHFFRLLFLTNGAPGRHVLPSLSNGRGPPEHKSLLTKYLPIVLGSGLTARFDDGRETTYFHHFFLRRTCVPVVA